MWKDKYKVGVEKIDEQHEELFGRLSIFIKVVQSEEAWDEKIDEVKETLNFLQEYVVYHFDDEEAYQERINYPEISSHKEEHVKFKQTINDYVNIFEQGGFTEEKIQELSAKVMTWLIMHIGRVDQKLAEYANSLGGESVMKVEYINSFYKAVQDVFKLMLDLEIERKDLKVVEESIEGNDANIMLGITGDLKGSVFFSFTKDMSLEMVKIMSGMEMKEIDMFVSSALGEVVNITGGNALIDLNKYDYTCDITTPQVILGHCQSVSISNDKAVVIPMTTDIGEFDVTISLSDS